MKKVLILAVLFLCVCSCALAADAGVVVIGGEEKAQAGSADLSNIKLNTTYSMDGYADIVFTDFSFNDKFKQYSGSYYTTFDSGSEADYALLSATLTNTQFKEVQFKTGITDVVVTYDESYKFGGFVYQRDNDKYAIKYEKDEFPIKMLYNGYYYIGCTLPNLAVKGDKSLVLTFKINGEEATYVIR